MAIDSNIAPNAITDESDDTYEMSYQNVLGLLSTISNQVADLNKNPAKKNFTSNLDQLYSSLVKCVPIFPESSATPNLASPAKKSRERKFSASDKQLRLVANEKSKPGRKPLKKTLKKPDTPMKQELMKALLNPKIDKRVSKRLFQKGKKPKNVQSKVDTNQPKRGRGRPRKNVQKSAQTEEK